MNRFAIVGCGRHMQGTLSKYLCQLNGIRFVYCIDHDPLAAENVKKMLNAEQALKSLQDIDFTAVDAAIIAVPPKSAYEIASVFINNRIPCFIEKPPAPSTDQIQKLIHLSVSNKTGVQVGFNFRFADAIIALDRHSKDDDNREVLLIDFLSKYPSDPEWGIDNVVEAWLRHNGIHALDLACHFLGPFNSVDAHINIINNRFLLTVLSRHMNNKVSVCRLGNLTGRFLLRAELWTRAGQRLTMPNLGELSLQDDESGYYESSLYHTKNLDSGWSRAGYGTELDYFLANFTFGENITPSLRDALMASNFADAILSCIS